MIRDLASLGFQRNKFGMARMVGVVGNSYFTAHGFGYAGLTKNFFDAFLIAEASVESVPHELGHVFGQSGEAYCESALFNGTCLAQSAQGIFFSPTTMVSTGEYLGWIINGYDATMGINFSSSPSPGSTYAISIMAEDLGNGENANLNDLLPHGSDPGYWMDISTYEIILKNLMNPPPDPEVVIISGVLTEAGEFTFGPSATLSGGTLTSSNSAGNLKINALDQSGKILSSVAIETDFTINVLYPPGKVTGPAIVDAGAMPVVVTLPANQAIDSFSVVQNGKVIKQTSLSAQTLQGVIESIPISAFKEPDECKRVNQHDKREVEFCQDFIAIDQKILNKEVTRIQSQLNSKNPKRAIGQLNELVAVLGEMLSSSYPIMNSSNLTKKEIIAEIESIAISVSLRKDQEKEKCKKELNDNEKGKSNHR
jgi:hypothetical protein